MNPYVHLGCHAVAAVLVVQDPVVGLVFDAADVHDSFGGADVWDPEGASPESTVGPFDADVLVFYFRIGNLPTTTAAGTRSV